MALTLRAYVSFNMEDGKGRPCGNTYYVPVAAAKAYVAAADQAARDATLIGVLRLAYLAMTEAVEVDTTVSYENYESAVVPPADETVLRGNKLSFGVTGGGQDRRFEIPARDASAYDNQDNTLEVPIISPTAMSNFVAAYAAVVTDAFGNARIIQSARVVD